MTAGDSGIVENAGKSVEEGLVSAERFARSGLCFGLLDDVRGNRSGE
jgi:hypothetical protein